MPDLDQYLETLNVEDRSLAREFGVMPSQQFQARMGPLSVKLEHRFEELKLVIDDFKAHLDSIAPSPNGKRGLSRIAAINLGDVAKTIGGGIVVAIGLFIRGAN